MPQANTTSSSSSGSSRNPLKGAVEIISDRLFYCALKTPPSSHKVLLRNKRQEKIPVKCFCIDDELVYWNFFLDFGPLNLGQLYRFTVLLNNLLVQQSKNEKNHPAILFYSSTDSAKRTNAIYLICAWQVLELKRTPEQAFFGFQYYLDNPPPPQSQPQIMVDDEKSDTNTKTNTTTTNNNPSFTSKIQRHCSLPPPLPLTPIANATLAPLPTFHDASPIRCTFPLTLHHCLQGLVKARQLKFFDWDGFNVEEYEYFEQVENGDLNWIIDGKILAFAGPSYKKNVSPEGYCTLAPADYIPYFQSKNVGLVVRLNKKNYEEKDFVDAGIDHLEQFYLDGSCPPMRILQRVLRAFEAVPKDKAFAVHCKAGLGRTGTCIGAYMMKHYRMTAPEVIGWMRICRPGMVIGPQQQFLQDLEPIMWQEGEIMQIKKSIPLPLDTTSDSSTSERKSGSGRKKRSTKSRKDRSATTKDIEQAPMIVPVSPTASAPINEAEDGRPGQAEALLASRRQRQAAATQAKIKAGMPVPITPDSVSGGESKSFISSMSTQDST